ncbi:putative 50S ribosomal protein L23 [Cardiosporidium cionae]|uniref:Large ribosomal subunit protein uL23m n=1 Tax=Cardiosporidium cionae TaxID=476202 RepID=A0ABQ7JFI2_9APIC|nr:putative 50S ribosomal protein L23 [Cardiosporidium cionae]|eukprot:KAF8822744.1 putative 50S ribosomal protein L23 [Cardiosporidium cionae]
MFVSRSLLAPPKTPRNVFFPWHGFSVHQTGAFLERNRLALRVPVNLTKFEIREYLRKIYEARVIKVNTLIKIPEIRRNMGSKKMNYYRNGPMYKKAIITLEDAVPDTVKMISSCRNVGRNPAITKKNVSYGVRSDLKSRPKRSQLWSMGERRSGWRLPLSNLLAGDDWQLNPDLAIDENYSQMQPNPRLPFMHNGVSTTSRIPENVPDQSAPMIDVTPWRRQVQRLIKSGVLSADKFHGKEKASH